MPEEKLKKKKAQFICPHCFEKHDENSIRLKCIATEITIDPNTGDKVVNPYGCKHQHPHVEKEKGGWIPKEFIPYCLSCSAYKQIYCSTIEQEIPQDFLENPNGFSIALVGGPGSGKTNYIGVAINEIQKKMSVRFNCRFNTCASEQSWNKYLRDYYDMLYKRGVLPRKTDVSQDGASITPMIFPLQLMDRRNNPKDLIILTFYDAAGEHFDSAKAIVTNTKYIPNAKGIIMLFDTLQVPEIRQRLKGKIDLPPESDATTILSRVVDVIRRTTGIPQTKKIPIPLALVFTKIDVLEQFDDILDDSSCLRTESQHLDRGVFVQSDFNSVNREIRSLISNFVDQELEQHMKCFEKYAFFGVSALGAMPKDRANLSCAVKPRRVLDPFLWLMAQEGLIKSVKY